MSAETGYGILAIHCKLMQVVTVGQIRFDIVGDSVSTAPVTCGSVILRHYMLEERVSFIVPHIVGRAHSGLAVKQRSSILRVVDKGRPVFTLECKYPQFIFQSLYLHSHHRHFTCDRLKLYAYNSLCLRIGIVLCRCCNGKCGILRHRQGNPPSVRFVDNIVEHS